MFTVRFPVGTIVFISDPEVIKEIFTGDPDVLHAGEGNAAPLEPIMGKNSVLLLDGAEHMRQRKLMLPSFHGERMQRYGDLMREIAEREIRRLARRRAVSAASAHAGDHARDHHAHGLRDRGRGPPRAPARSPRPAARHRHAPDGAGDDRRCPALRRTVGRRTWKRFVALRDDVDAVLYDEIAPPPRSPRTSPSATTCCPCCSRRATRRASR